MSTAGTGSASSAPEAAARDTGLALALARQQQRAEAEQRAAQHEQDAAGLREELRQRQENMPPCLWANGRRLEWKGRGGEGAVYQLEGSAAALQRPGDLAVKVFTQTGGVRGEVATTLAVRELGHAWARYLVLPEDKVHHVPCACGGHLCTVYEAYDGDLAAAARELDFDLLDSLVVFRNVLRGASVLHSARLSHGDIKSANVLVQWRRRGAIEKVALGDVGGSHQTACWLPPDRIGCHAISTTDVYAAALVFADVATGCAGPLPPGQRDAVGVRSALQGLRVPTWVPPSERPVVLEKAVLLAASVLERPPYDRLDAAPVLAEVDDLLRQIAPPP
eukprot:TRINITY_DN24330_c0_g1_i2.p1 TRINITY_DN24330_c0_g1~~TRINITY_DN24330_c0_g1_i2.p1  ORF type:complete len:335 (+),score=80.01 TRINITY_DN24330_c0_g1_i2:461-1465(+)